MISSRMRTATTQLASRIKPEELLNVLASLPPQSVPKSEYEQFRKELARERGEISEPKNSLSAPMSSEHESMESPPPEPHAPRDSYLSGYGPKGEAPRGGLRPYMDASDMENYEVTFEDSTDDNDIPELESGKHDKFEVSQPKLQPAPKKRREYLEDTVSSPQADEVEVPGGGGTELG